MATTKDKVVWITGASSGIGEALVIQLAQEGAKLILSSRNREALEQVAKKAKLAESHYLILPLDLSKLDNAAQLTQAVMQRFGRIDLLVNNGGISQRSLFVETKPEVFRSIMEVNFFGGLALTRAVIPVMQHQKEGKIVAISSVTGKFGTPLRSAYAASKHAMHGFYDSLRAELYNNHISVLLVAPGYVKTQVSVNALLGDGSKNNTMDEGQAQGITAAACAKAIVLAIKAEKHEIYPGKFKEVGAVYLKRFFPSILRNLVRKVNVR